LSDTIPQKERKFNKVAQASSLLSGLETTNQVPKLFNLQFTIYSLQFTIYSLQFTVYSLQFTIYSLQFTVYNLQFTIYSLQFTVYNLQFTVYNLQFTVYNLQFPLPKSKGFFSGNINNFQVVYVPSFDQI
jgi:hypothetical protein